jgi:6-phosphogluconolactonase
VIKIRTSLGILACAVLILTGCNIPEKQALLAGGFTTGNEKGLALFSFDPKSGKMDLKAQYDGGPCPTLFCFSEKRDLVYAIDEVPDFMGQKAGGITTLRVDKDFTLAKVGEIPVPYGGPCHVSLSKGGKFLFVASYASGSVAVVRVGTDGIPEKVTDTIQYNPVDSLPSHPHMIQQDPLSRHIYLTDLGLNRVLVYDLDTASGKIIRKPFEEIAIPKGSGPRHFVFNEAATRMYLINELGSTVMTFDVAADGSLKLLQTVKTTADTFTGHNQSGEIAIGRDGKFLYGSNRGENSIVVFKINKEGMLDLAGRSTCGGDWPRNFIIDPSGRFLFSGNQKSDDISVFGINPETGIPEGPRFKVMMKTPAFLEFFN